MRFEDFLLQEAKKISKNKIKSNINKYYGMHKSSLYFDQGVLEFVETYPEDPESENKAKNLLKQVEKELSSMGFKKDNKVPDFYDDEYDVESVYKSPQGDLVAVN